MTTDRRTYADGTYLETDYPWGWFVGGSALCPDNKVRKLKRIAGSADTFFSIPASVTCKGKTIAGYVGTRTRGGWSVEADEDPIVVRFYPYKYRKNWDVFDIPQPPTTDTEPTTTTDQGTRR